MGIFHGASTTSWATVILAKDTPSTSGLRMSLKSHRIENYRRFRGLTTKWVELEIELAKLRRDQGRLKRRITGKE